MLRRGHNIHGTCLHSGSHILVLNLGVQAEAEICIVLVVLLLHPEDFGRHPQQALMHENTHQCCRLPLGHFSAVALSEVCLAHSDLTLVSCQQHRKVNIGSTWAAGVSIMEWILVLQCVVRSSSCLGEAIGS